MNEQAKRGLLFGIRIQTRSLTFVLLLIRTVLISMMTLSLSLGFRLLCLLKRLSDGIPGFGDPGAERGIFELVCISHVPWEGLWQRNQQTMSRLSKSEKVIYARSANALEIADNRKHLKYLMGKEIEKDLFVISPVILWGDTRFDLIRRLNRWILISYIRFAMIQAGFTALPRVLWFYFPRSEYICGGLGENLIVYDILDEYTTWTTATRDIVIRERNLLEKADLVITGTNSLCKKKREWNPNIHFVQNGVEKDHFGQALDERTEVPSDLKPYPRPVIGYFGLLGDRIDVSIIEKLTDKHPEWTIALVGPVREDMCTLPERPNILVTGQRDYETLPGYLKGFDVAIIPYLLNETTMDLNPTKLLEYLAGGKPVVSTAMTDVVELFSEYVRVAHDSEEFLELTERAVENPDKDQISRGVLLANGFTWEAMATKIRGLVIDSLEKKRSGEP